MHIHVCLYGKHNELNDSLIVLVCVFERGGKCSLALLSLSLSIG